MISPHSFTESLRAFLAEALPDIPVHTPVNTGELVVPYLLLSCIAETERIPGNHTWECTLSVALHTSGDDQGDTASRELFGQICRMIGNPRTRDRLNKSGQDFSLYALALRSIEEPLTSENNFIQSATFRVVIQF